MNPEQIKSARIIYPMGFFEIQEHFARRVSNITEIPFGDALLRHTSFYKRIGAENWDFNAENPLWISFIARINSAQPPAEAAFELHMASQATAIDNAKRFGCMGFDCRETTIVLHFRNDFNSAQG